MRVAIPIVLVAVVSFPSPTRAETPPWEVRAAAGYLQTASGTVDPYAVGMLGGGFHVVPAFSIDAEIALGFGLASGPPGCGPNAPPLRRFTRLTVDGRATPVRLGPFEPWIGIGAGALAMETMVCGKDTDGRSPGTFLFLTATAGASFFVSDAVSVGLGGRVLLVPFGAASGGDATNPSYPSYPYGTSPWLEASGGVTYRF